LGPRAEKIAAVDEWTKAIDTNAQLELNTRHTRAMQQADVFQLVELDWRG
jgi:hypothetical protein